MADKNRTTLSGITSEQLLRLKYIALQMTGEISVSALIRHIADKGILEGEGKGVGQFAVTRLTVFPRQIYRKPKDAE